MSDSRRSQGARQEAPSARRAGDAAAAGESCRGLMYRIGVVHNRRKLGEIVTDESHAGYQIRSKEFAVPPIKCPWSASSDALTKAQ